MSAVAVRWAPFSIQVVGILWIADIPAVGPVIRGSRQCVRNQRLKSGREAAFCFDLQSVVIISSEISSVERIASIEREGSSRIDLCWSSGPWLQRGISCNIQIQPAASTAYIRSCHHEVFRELMLNIHVPLLGHGIFLSRIPKVSHCSPRNTCRSRRNWSSVDLVHGC